MNATAPAAPQAITWLAKEWERLLAALEYPTHAYALRLLHVLAQSFLRGGGMRMGSWCGGFQKYQLTAALLECRVFQRVVDDPGKQIWFPTLVQLGFTDRDAVTEIMKQDLLRSADL